MADIWMDVDVALAEVPVNIMPLIDDPDFKSREVGITYDQAGMDLVWNFVTTAGAMSQTAVTPTTGGAYDWAHQGDGMYSIEMPASGGGDINNDTEGFGWFTGFATGVLPWRGPIIGFRAAGLNDLLIDSAYSATRGLAGTALPAAAADAAGGLPISDAGALDLDTQIGTDIDAILTDTAVIGALGAGLTAIPWNSAWDAEVESEVADALVANNLDHLAKTATAAADMTTEVADNTILSRILANGDTSAFVPSTDGLQLIRDKQTDIETDTAEIGVAGAGLSDLGGMSTGMKAEIESEANDALVALNLDHLMKEPTAAADMTTEIVDNTALSRILANGDTSAFIPSTDGLQPIRDQGDAAWDTATGFSTHSAADAADAVWDEVSTGHVSAGKAGQQLWTDVDAILADTNELQTDDYPTSIAAVQTTADAIETDTQDLQTQVGTDGAGLTNLPWNSSWDAEVQSECADALTAYDPPTDTEMDTAFAALNDIAVTDVTQRQIPDSVPADGTRPTIEQSLYMIVQFLMERAVSDTTVTVKKVDGSTALLTLTLDDATDPTSITRAT